VSERAAIITEIISPYRIPLFNALAQRPEISLHVLFLAETDASLRQWEIYRDEIRFSHEVLPSWRKRLGKHNLLMNSGVSRALRTVRPQAILCGGYNYIASWQALVWARTHAVPFLLWSESNIQDQRRGYPLVEFLKREFLDACSGFVVPGQSAREYLRAHKVKECEIFTAPNAVDNRLFAEIAGQVRQNAADYRRKLSLPSRYFLFVGRLVPEKGVFDLLDAYARLDEHLRAEVGLVFAGDGPGRSSLEEQARKIAKGVIRFAGFVQRNELAKYYALAEMLILPTHSDPWGLVVNEAMACGLPIVLSNVAGAAADLVRDAGNGRLLPPADVAALTAAMRELGSDQIRCHEMGVRSQQHIANYSPEAWAAGAAQALTLSRRVS